MCAKQDFYMSTDKYDTFFCFSFFQCRQFSWQWNFTKLTEKFNQLKKRSFRYSPEESSFLKPPKLSASSEVTDVKSVWQCVGLESFSRPGTVSCSAGHCRHVRSLTHLCFLRMSHLTGSHWRLSSQAQLSTAVPFLWLSPLQRSCVCFLEEEKKVNGKLINFW